MGLATKMGEELFRLPIVEIALHVDFSGRGELAEHQKLFKVLDFNELSDSETTEKGSSSKETVAGRVKVSGRKRRPPMKLRDPMKKNKKQKLELSPVDIAATQYIANLCSSKETSQQRVFRSRDAMLWATDMDCLIQPDHVNGEDNYLNSCVVDAYAAHLAHRSVDQTRLYCPMWQSELLANTGSVKSCLDLDFWKKVATDYFAHDLVFFPMQVKNGIQEHLILVVMNVKKEVFQILDSLWDLQMYKDRIESLRAGIAQITSVARTKEPKLPTDVNSWEIVAISRKKVPMQDDESSCGLYLLKNLENWDGSKLQSKYTQEDVKVFRKKLVAELLLSETNMEAACKEAIRQILEASNPPNN